MTTDLAPEPADAASATDVVEGSSGPAPRAPLDRRRLVIAAAWLVGGAAAVHLVDGFLGGAPAAAAVLGAVLVDLLAGRAGVRWASRPWALDVRVGAALGATVGLLAVAAGHALGWATVVLGAPGIAIAFAVLRVGAVAARDELLLRWLPIALGRRAGVPDRALLAFVVAIAIAPALGTATAVEVAVLGAVALLGGRLALATGGALAPAAAHAALLLALGPMTRGGVLDVTWWRGDPGPAGAAGAAGWVTAGVIAVVAIAAPRLIRPRATPAGSSPAT